MTSSVAIGVDLGATLTRVCAFDNGKITAKKSMPTQHPLGTKPPQLMARIMVMIEELLTELGSPNKVTGIGFGVPGPTNGDTGIVYKLPNVPGWESPFPLRQEFSRAYFPGTQVYVDNDANVAGLAEYGYGAGYGVKNLVYVTWSSGIGTGVIINGQVLRGGHGLAAELGHMIMSIDGPPCGCGNKGCLEALASGTAIARMAVEKGFHNDAKEVAQAALSGKSWAQEIIDKAAEAFGNGLISIVNVFDPDKIVIGGGVSKSGDLVLKPALRVLRASTFGNASKVPVELAQLGEDIGLYGAAALVVKGGAQVATRF